MCLDTTTQSYTTYGAALTVSRVAVFGVVGGRESGTNDQGTRANQCAKRATANMELPNTVTRNKVKNDSVF